MPKQTTQASAPLLFELGTEELPPLALKHLADALGDGFRSGLSQAGVAFGEVTTYATPRRLAVLIRDCALCQADQDLERRGPAYAAAFDKDGRPSKATQGFARACGTSVDALQRLDNDKGSWLVYRSHSPGQATIALLPGIAAESLNRLPTPKRMRWGSSDVMFVRPVHWLLFMLGDQTVPCTLLDAVAGNRTFGHRFHHPAAIVLDHPEDYEGVLRSVGKVIASFDLRKAMVVEQVKMSAEAIHGRADLDEALIDEVTALNEWPVPISGTFEAGFLAVPQEALVATMKGNQKYFPVFDSDDRLVNRFITIANIESSQPELIRAGNERVIRPRLADAMFFWEKDCREPLAARIPRLASVIFHNQLGTMADKSQRVASLAVFIAEVTGGDPGLAARAAALSRCDLLTEMVFEFPEMQGIMGRHLAERDGEAREVAKAMDEFYMPRFSGGELPQTATGICVSLAEKIDTLVGIFGIGLKPTGDKDPFGLRRAALGALRILREHALEIGLPALLEQGKQKLGSLNKTDDTDKAVLEFMLERLKGLYLDLGVALDVYEAVAALRPVSIADFDRRINAVTVFRALPEAAALAAANKRIGNILKKTDVPQSAEIDVDLFESTAERDLHAEILAMQGEIAPFVEVAAYGPLLRALARLRVPVDRFFEEVMVMSEDQRVRANRLAMVQALHKQFSLVADLSLLQVDGS